MPNQNDSRKKQILKMLLKSPEGMSIDEMAIELHISRNAVKQHLVILESRQLVQEGALNITGGRPARSYRLTEHGINQFPKQYAQLCDLFLTEVASKLGSKTFQQMMCDLGNKQGNSLALQLNHKDSPDKLNMLVKLMQDIGYHAELSKNTDQPTIKVSNCIYHDLAQKHPEICQFDRALISAFLEKPIHQTSCIAKRDCACNFNVAGYN